MSNFHQRPFPGHLVSSHPPSLGKVVCALFQRCNDAIDPDFTQRHELEPERNLLTNRKALAAKYNHVGEQILPAAFDNDRVGLLECIFVRCVNERHLTLSGEVRGKRTGTNDIGTKDVTVEPKISVQGGREIGGQRDANGVSVGALFELFRVGSRRSGIVGVNFVISGGGGDGFFEKTIDESLETRLLVGVGLAARFALAASVFVLEFD